MFIVVLLIAMLTAIGVFAANAASLATTSSGHARQSTQARYLTELSLQATTSLLGNPDLGPEFIRQLRVNSAFLCDASAPERCCFAALSGDRCIRFSRTQVEGYTGPLLEQPTPTVPGSLGRASLEYRFEVQMTDSAPAKPPPPGMDLTSAGAVDMQSVMVTLNATGVIYPAPASIAGGNTPSDDRAVVAAAGYQEVLSAHVVVNNVPAK
ncbi:hypothetical protein [Chondromyces apiculatus]|uniref:Type 4 fimbrial biogenesis protein PilX N-terminal domain-containing protein n=1 Tax=Chondromyces apiculatus DSM 436 TaxID=1192034 RepID=A0A017SXM3_9BACT|nr:hypothetical protein [Chondromyces apiculatus]EYF01713.1 Hypothetical protein CAP_7918 [Chondromyces apiculatus DSM 436]